jgi:probable rRNA maturation factor
MSFPIDDAPENPEEYRHLGDVVVCPATAYLHAKANPSLFWDELTLYIIHGLLHLLGYDDIDPNDRAIMRRQERRARTLANKRALLLKGPVSYHVGKNLHSIKKHA